MGFFYWDQFSDEAETSVSVSMSSWPQECARDAEQKLWTGAPRASDVDVFGVSRFDRGGDGIRWKSYDPVSGHELGQGVGTWMTS